MPSPFSCHGSDLKPLPTREAGGARTDAAEEEDDEMLEMIPLTRAHSLEDSGSGGGEDLGLQGVSLGGSGTTGHTADEDTPAGNEPSDDGGTSAAEDSQEVDQRLLSSQRGNGEQLGFADEAGRTHAPGSLHGHVGGLRGSGKVKGFGVDGSGAENRRLRRRRRRRSRSACWQECLVPAKLLHDKQIRATIFVYAAFSVRGGAVPRLSAVQIEVLHRFRRIITWLAPFKATLPDQGLSSKLLQYYYVCTPFHVPLPLKRILGGLLQR